jgi:triosephosphate isomerase
MNPSQRRPLVAANWKMHLLRADARAFCRTLVRELGAPPAEVVIFPSFPLIDSVVDGLAGMPVAVGGQDLHPDAAGAHTGDVSAQQLADAGCTWVLSGHSERRADHGEDDALVAAKARAARTADLVPLVCVGETGDQRRAGQTFAVLERQMAALFASEGGDLDRFDLAYEPVWAIGTGETATPEIAQQAHAFVRAELVRRLGSERAESIRILYGGSVKPANAASLGAGQDIDGFLVGGASLDAESFSGIIGACGVRT